LRYRGVNPLLQFGKLGRFCSSTLLPGSFLESLLRGGKQRAQIFTTSGLAPGMLYCPNRLVAALYEAVLPSRLYGGARGNEFSKMDETINFRRPIGRRFSAILFSGAIFGSV
jgi:hypothetical protein